MIKVLIADDKPQLRDIWQYIITTRSSYSLVASCNDGQEAIDAAGTHQPDIILMDISMRPVNGIEATAEISKRYPGIRVIGMSTLTDESYINRMLSAGASGYVTKNTPYEEILQAIQVVYEGRRYLCEELRGNPRVVLMD